MELTRQTVEQIKHAIIYETPVSLQHVPDKSILDITLFVACYNEEENIVATLNEVVTAMASLDFSWEIIVVDDASTDNSVALLLQYMQLHPDCPITLLVREHNEGLAENYFEAAFLGCGRHYKLINGDNVESSCQIASILSQIGSADMLIPYHSRVLGRTFFRRWLSRIFTLLVNFVSGYRLRYYNGCAVHLRYDVMRCHQNGSGFDFQANLIVRLLGLGRTYLEIPVIGGEREFGHSKALTLKNFLSAARFFMNLIFGRIWRMLNAK